MVRRSKVDPKQVRNWRRKNHITKDLHSPKYRQRVKEDKKRKNKVEKDQDEFEDQGD